MHVYMHYTVLQRGHEPPPTGFEPATSTGLGAPSTPQPPVPFALLWLNARPRPPLLILLPFRHTEYPYPHNKKRYTNYTKCIFRIAPPTNSSSKKSDVPQNHESAHRPSLSVVCLSLSAVLSQLAVTRPRVSSLTPSAARRRALAKSVTVFER